MMTAEPSARLCSRCRRENAAPNQRWGRECRNAGRRDARRRRREENAQAPCEEQSAADAVSETEARSVPSKKTQRPEGEQPSIVLASPKVAGSGNDVSMEKQYFAPFPAGVPDDLPSWVCAYLAKLAETGGPTLSANAAGVTPRMVRRLAAEHDGFAEAAEAALNFYADALAIRLPDSSRPIGFIARLKSIRPSEYESALLVQNFNTLNVNAPPPPGVDPVATLRAMLGATTDATRRMITGGAREAGALTEAGLLHAPTDPPADDTPHE